MSTPSRKHHVRTLLVLLVAAPATACATPRAAHPAAVDEACFEEVRPDSAAPHRTSRFRFLRLEEYGRPPDRLSRRLTWYADSLGSPSGVPAFWTRVRADSITMDSRFIPETNIGVARGRDGVWRGQARQGSDAIVNGWMTEHRYPISFRPRACDRHR